MALPPAQLDFCVLPNNPILTSKTISEVHRYGNRAGKVRGRRVDMNEIVFGCIDLLKRFTAG